MKNHRPQYHPLLKKVKEGGVGDMTMTRWQLKLHQGWNRIVLSILNRQQ